MQSSGNIIDCYKQDFITRLRKLRNKHCISAREMSIALGQNVNYVNLIENGRRLPSLQGFFAICDFFKISPSDFFVREESPETAFFSLSSEQKQSIFALINAFR